MMSHAPHAPWSGLETLEPRLLLSAADSVFGITAASPLGGTGDDAVRGAVLQDDGTIVLAANISDATPGGLTPTLLNGATASSPGALVRLSADGQTVLGVTRLAEKVLDLSEDDSGNLYVAMHDQGFAKLSPDASSILYSRTTADLGFANVQRIDTGPLGYTAVLGGGGLDSGSNLGPNVRVYDPAGTLLGSDNSGRWKNDVAIDEASQTVVYLGYRNAYDSASGLPVQVSYYRGIAYDGTVKYTGYDWSTSETDPNYLNGPENNMADTRGYRAEIGEDGYLYLAFESAGGNNIFNHDPFDINTDVSLAGGDRWHVPYATGANHITYFGRYQPGNGQYVLGNHYLTRLSDNDGNTLRIQKGSITADADGRVYLGGSSAWGLPLEGHPLGDSNVSFNPGVNNNYLGGAFLTVMSPGMDSRLYTTRLAGDWVHAVAVEPRADGDDAIVFGGGTSGEVWLHDGVQMTAGGADDGWFGVIADSDPDPTNSAPLADFQAASAGGTTDTILLSLDATGSDDPDGDPLQYLWVFGDGERAEGVTVTHEISSTANRTVTLTVLDGRGGWATSSTTFGPPDAAFQMSGFRGEAPLAVEFDASATTGAENPHLLSYQWDFGDGTLGGGISARHEYAEPGAYEVTLTVTDALGATSIATDLITVTDPAAWTMRLDFEGADGDTADGFLHAPIEAYTPEVGYGYETVDPEYQVVNQGNFADEMLTDGHDAGTSYHVVVPATYLVDVPNGQYRVIIHSATGKYGQMNLGISAEGEEVERFWYVDPYTRDAAVFDVAVTDGQLTLDLAADYGIAAGSWKWSGLEIVRMGTQIDSSPVLSGSPHGPQAYADGSGPMAVAPDLTLTDDGTSLIQGATVRIHDGLLTSQDVLHATTVGNISAVYDASAGVLTISGADSAAHYQAVLRSVTYESTAAVAGGGMREVTFRLNDGQTHSNLLAAYVLPTGAGTKTIVDDFESYSAGDLLDGSGHWSAENNADIVADPAEAGNLAGHVWDRTTDARNTSPDLLVADGEKASLFFRACIVDPGAGGNFGLAVSGSDTVSAGTLMESSDVKIGPAGGPTQFEPIDGVWYRMWIEIDNADDTQTLYIQSDGDFKYATRTQIGSRSFNGGSAGDLADFVAKFKNHPDAMHVYLDDLQVISEGPATVAEPVVNVIASDSLAAEQDPVDKGTWTFSRSGDTTDPLTVHYTVDSVPDAGEYNTDTPLTGSVTIPAGSVFATIDLTAVDDDRVEDFEVVTLALAADPAYNIGSKPLAMVGIVDDEIPATVDVMTSDPDAGEAGPNPGEFTFTRTGPTTYDLQVTYEVSGSAEPGDYSADPLLSGTITIPAGSDSASVTVTPVDDMLEEGYEELRLSLVYGGPEYVIGPSGDAVLVIVDDEQPIDYLLIDDFESYQIGDPINDYDYWTGSDGDAAVEIDPADAANQALHSFNRHEDVINQHPSLRVFDGQTATLFYRMYADQLSQPTASIGMHVGQKDYTLAASTDINNTGVEGRAIQTGVWYNVWMVLDHGNNVVDLYMQSDSDPGFAAQQKVAENIAFKTSNWSDPQALSSFNIHHFNNPDTTSLRVDDIYFAAGDASLVNPLAPDAVLVSIQATDPEAAEDGSDTGAFTVTRTGDTTDPLTVDYTVGGTATDDDYTASPTLDGSITIAAGSSTATIVITATPDSEPELDETIEIALSAGTDYGMAWPSAAAVSIIDDDGPAQVPYGAGPWQVTDGLRLEAEDFDTMTEGSGEGLAYHDTDSGNNGGQYRDTGVDIGNSGDTDGGYSIGWIDNNEWLEYTVDVTGGSYDIHARVASADGNPGDLRLVLGGTPLGGDGQVLGTFPVEDTGGWQNWVTLTLPGVTLSDGQEQILRLEMDGELFNVNWIEFEAISPPTVTQVVRDGGTGSPDELNQLAFAFNKDVSASLTASDLAVYNDTSDQPVDNSAVTMTWDAGSNTATFDVSPLGLTAGYYTFTLAATDVTDEGGNPLDGDGDGTGGDDFSTQLLVAPAGDANTDGKVSLADLSSLAGNWDSTTATWEEGDFNGDGKVSLGDLSALAGNWNANVQATPVDATESDAQLQTTSAPTAEVEQQPSTSTVSVLDEVQAVPVAPATTLEASPTPGDSTIATDLALQGSPTPAESIEPDMAYLLRPAETDGDGETEGGALLEIPLGE